MLSKTEADAQAKRARDEQLAYREKLRQDDDALARNPTHKARAKKVTDGIATQIAEAVVCHNYLYTRSVRCEIMKLKLADYRDYRIYTGRLLMSWEPAFDSYMRSGSSLRGAAQIVWQALVDAGYSPYVVKGGASHHEDAGYYIFVDATA